jgi:hypothetical protein
MTKEIVAEVIRQDRWAGVAGENNARPFLLRYRTPVLAPPVTRGYGRVLKIVWPYSDEGTGALPLEEDTVRMVEFEKRFCSAVEHDATAILTAVLTFDGARQWVFYTGDIQECGERLNKMTHGARPFPLELTTEHDSDWRYLRNEILRRAPAESG